MITKKSKGVHRIHCFDSHVSAAFSGRQFDATKRGDFLHELHLDPDKLVLLKQVHSANICLVSESHQPGTATAADGMICATPGMVLGILTADCVPVFFSDEKKCVVGIAHAGWRGIHHGIVRKMVQAFKQNFMSNTEDILVAFGPAARKCCYEVGDEFSEIFPDFYSASKVPSRSHKGHMDLIAAITYELQTEGIRADQITDSGQCTYCQNDEYYSYRADSGTKERILSVISLKK